MRRPWPNRQRVLSQLVAGLLLVSCGSPEPIDEGPGSVTATITTPGASATFHGGLTIQFSGSGTDGSGRSIPASGLSWWAEFHHDGQVDVIMAVTTGPSGSLSIPNTGITSSNIFYRLFLRASDGSTADTVSRDIPPETMQLTIASEGTGRTITLDGNSYTTPLTVTAVVGMQREIAAPSPQSANDSTYTFQSWSDAGSQTHTIDPPATNATYTANFSAAGPSPTGPPTAVIATPIAGASYRGGENIQFSGSGQDAGGTILPGSSLTWWAEFHHAGTTDPFMPVTAGASGSVMIPTTGDVTTSAFYRFYLRAVDAQGAADTVFRDITPQTTQLTIASLPVGRTITLDGIGQTAPLTVTAVVGIVRQVGVPSPQTKADSTFTFQSWSDGGGQTHVISPPAGNTTFTATFSAAGPPPLGTPTAVIGAPAAGATYRAGNTLTFSGSGTGSTGSVLPSSALTWWLEFHHDGVTDTVLAPASGNAGTYSVPTVEISANVFYRFKLVALDNGIADTVFRDVLPQTIQLTITTAPVGRALTIDGIIRTAPYVVTGVIGVVRQIGVTSPQTSNDSTFTFTTWSDGGAQSHSISTPAGSTTYTANFSVLPPQPPSAVISTPLVGATYQGGSTINYAGTATDMHGIAITGNSLSWWAELHHDDHTHPFIPVTPGGAGSTVIPTSSEVSSNVFYRFSFRAVDSRGLADTVFRDVLPEKAQLTVTSNPVGRTITLDGQPQTAPFTVTGVVGIEREIGAPSPQSGLDSTYTFQSWSDGGTQTHSISTPATNTTYTATFTAVGPANVPPTVAITSPANNASIVVNTVTPINATANDVDGTVTTVQFFDGATLLGADNTSPYSFSWTPTVAGPHSLTARATDDDGATTTSVAVPVTVTGGGGGDNQAPTVSLTSPHEGDEDLTGVNTATATATDNVGVVGVEFQVDGVTIGEDLSSPFSMALPNTSGYTTGPHQIRARSRDAAGNQSPWATIRVTFGGNVDMPTGFSRTGLIQNLGTTGTAMTFAPDGRLFICQQDGDLRVVKNGALLSAPFVHVPTTENGERGLLGVAFHPNFGTAGSNYVYLYYTTTSGGVAHNRISRYTANGDVAVSGSEEILVELPDLNPAATYHNGGAIHFGPDGKLYAALGDNGTGSNAQSTGTRLGKILRYNPDGTIPADNPSLGTGLNKAIWAMGLRNPFTFGFQPGTGRMFINDVGESSWEEINEGQAGANYGWPTTEGATSNPAFTGPLFTYAHSGQPSTVVGLAIVGSGFYNPSSVAYPADYVGDYFFADYVNHWVNRLDLAASNNAVYAFARLPDSVTDLAVGPDGKLYALAVQSNGTWGVYRFDKN